MNIEKLTLKQMMENDQYYSLSDGLLQLPVPDKIKIGKYYDVPADLKAFSDSICYGQRLFMAVKEPNDFGAILRIMDGFYYPIVSGDIWDDDYALSFGKEILNCKVIEVYPVANHLVKLMTELVQREIKILQRKPSKQEVAAGIDKLSKFAELTSIKYLLSSFGYTEEQVMLAPYNDCLVEFMLAKEQNEFQERLAEVYKNEKK